MPVEVDVRVDEAQMNALKNKIRAVDPKKVDTIMRSAVKRAGTAAHTMSAKAIGTTYTIKSRDTKQDMKLVYQGAAAEFRISGFKHDVKDFKVQPAFSLQQKGIQSKGIPPPKVTIKKGHGGRIAGSFWARMPSGHINVYTRQGNDPLPIEDKRGLAVAQMAEQVIDREDIKARVHEVLNERVDHEIQRILAAR